VTLDWNTAGVKGTHTIRVTADQNNAIRESDETNNAATLAVTVKGNKVKNGSLGARHGLQAGRVVSKIGQASPPSVWRATAERSSRWQKRSQR
jgi:hypothetical protein